MNKLNQTRRERREIERMMKEMYDIALNNPKHGICCICGKPYHNHGNNARPFKDGRCCDECDSKYVLPYRIAHYDEYQAQMRLSEAEIKKNLAMHSIKTKDAA